MSDRFSWGSTYTWTGLDPCSGNTGVRTETMRRANKVHACCECHHPIVPGEVYQHFKSIDEDGCQEWKTCICCAKARCALTELLGEDACLIFGTLRDELRDHDMDLQRPVITGKGAALMGDQS